MQQTWLFCSILITDIGRRLKCTDVRQLFPSESDSHLTDFSVIFLFAPKVLTQELGIIDTLTFYKKRGFYQKWHCNIMGSKVALSIFLSATLSRLSQFLDLNFDRNMTWKFFDYWEKTFFTAITDTYAGEAVYTSQY